jgi:hypothetical protein
MNGGGGEGCARGAVSQVISKWVTVKTDTWGPAGQFAAATIAGGTTSALTGGKFATGAQTAAFGYLFNALAKRLKVVGGTIDQQMEVKSAVQRIDGTASGKELDAAIPPGEITVRIKSVVPLNANATLQAPFITTISPEFVDGLVCCYLDTKAGVSMFSLDRILAHELGHHTGLSDYGTPNDMGNVTKWENTIMRELSPAQPERSKYAPAEWPLMPAKQPWWKS